MQKKQKPIDIDLSALAGGGVSARLSGEMTKAIENILDENTKATAARDVVLKITLKPNEKRTRADMTVSVTSKLPAYEPITTELVMGKNLKGEVAAKEEYDAPLPMGDAPLMDAINGAGAGESPNTTSNVATLPRVAAL